MYVYVYVYVYVYEYVYVYVYDRSAQSSLKTKCMRGLHYQFNNSYMFQQQTDTHRNDCPVPISGVVFVSSCCLKSRLLKCMLVHPMKSVALPAASGVQAWIEDRSGKIGRRRR